MDGIRLAWMPALAILLSSCGIPQLRSSDPVRDLPVSFNGANSEQNSSQVPIDEFFNDPVLINLIDEGVAGNLDLKILAQNVEIANNEVLKRRGAYMPFVSAGAGASLNQYSPYTLLGSDNLQNHPPTGSFPVPLPDFMASADLTWQIDIWRQLRNSRDAAIFRYLGTAEGRNYVITRLVAEIAENYYGLMALDKRIENLDRTIGLQRQSLEMAKSQKEAAQGTELGVQRFQAEVRKNESQKLIIKQEIIEVENRINYLVGRYPEAVERMPVDFFNLNLHALGLGVPSELLQNRPDIRQAERELAAAGLDIDVARANFYPRLILNAGVGFDVFNPRYIFASPSSLIYNVAGGLVAPLINKLGIQAEYKNANAKQLQACYDYQRTILNAFTEVINRISKVQNYTTSIELKLQQVQALEASVDIAAKLFQAAQVEYLDVLIAQRDLMDGRMALIDTKREQLSAIVNTYQALGGGLVRNQSSEPQPALPGSTVPVPDLPAPETAVPESPMPESSLRAPKAPMKEGLATVLPVPAKRDEIDEILGINDESAANAISHADHVGRPTPSTSSPAKSGPQSSPLRPRP